MEPKTQITQSLSTVSSNITKIDVKIAVLIRTAQEAKQTLLQLHRQLQALRTSMQSLSACLQNPLFNDSTLTSVETKNETLFQYITTILVSLISVLKLVEEHVKHLSKSSKGGKVGFLRRKSKSEDISLELEANPTDLGEQVHFLALGLEIGVEIMKVHTITHITNAHLHDVREHTHALANATTNLQISRDSLIATLATQESASTMPDYSDICLRAIDFSTTVTKQADTEITLQHSGFEPMSPLVEVMSSVTVASVVELEK